MFDDSKSLSSTNLFERIWVTSFGGTGEKPGGNTHDCCRTGIVGRDGGTVGTSPVATLDCEGATEGTGGENLKTKDGTTKFGLPDIDAADPVIEAGTGGKPSPEAAKAEALNGRLDSNVAGTPPIAPATLGEA